MQLDLYLEISAQLCQLAHQLDRTYFDLKCLIPRAMIPENHNEVELKIAHIQAKIPGYITQRQLIFKKILSILGTHDHSFPAESRTLISQKMQRWHDNQQSYLDSLKNIPKTIIRRNSDPELTKQISDFCAQINAEDSASLQDLGITIGGLLFQYHLTYFTEQTERYIPGTLIKNRQFLYEIMSYQTKTDNQLAPDAIYKYFAWQHQRALPKKVTTISARDVLPEAAPTGLAADAIILTFHSNTEVFFILKGTEFHRDPNVTSLNPLKSWNRALVEAYRDWRYNVQAILLGEDTELSQIDVAKKFIALVKRQVPDDATFYGIGHSLGGHLVQALQLLYQPFNAGYTLNAAPVQLRQIYKLAPDLLPLKTWDRLLMTTLSGDMHPRDQALLTQTLGYDRYKITNEGFSQDFIQVFYNLHFNVYVGRFNLVQRPELRYPFIPAITNYLNTEEINFAAFTMAEFFRQTDEFDSNQSLRLQVIQFMRNWGKPPHLTPEKRTIFKRDYNRYLVACGVLKADVPNTPTHLPHIMTKHLSSGKIAIVRRLQPEICELLIYFHVIAGARFFFESV